MEPIQWEGPASTTTPSSVIIPRNKQRVRPIPVTTPSKHRAAVKTNLQKPKKLNQHHVADHTYEWSQDLAECPQSDWTIHIYPQWPSPNDVDKKTYYICTHALKKLPPNRVPLFERIFFECLEETGENESRLIIEDDSIAQAFGVLLDFLYAKNTEEEIELLSNVKKGRALYRIGEYFHALPLQKKVSTFYEHTTKEFRNHSGSNSNSNGKENRVLEPSIVNSTQNSPFRRMMPREEVKSDSSPASVASSHSFGWMTSLSKRSLTPPFPASVGSIAGQKWQPIKSKNEAPRSLSPVSIASSTSFPWQRKAKGEKAKKNKKEDTKSTKKRSLLDKRTQESPTVENEIMEPTALLQVLMQKRGLGTETEQVDSENISCLVALCMQQNKDRLKRTLFYKLTSKEYIPHIDPEAALQLLTIEAELDFWQDPDNFSSLQSRCIRSLLANWDVTRKKYKSDEDYWRALRKISPGVLAILLMHTSGTHYGDDDLSSLSYNPDF